MDFLTLSGIAFGLSMDAFSVSIATGCATKKNFNLQAFRMAIWFGTFQAIMPILGWFLGANFKSYLENFDHWIAFILLSYIGGKMIIESFSKNKEKSCEHSTPKMFLLAIATSIDAFAVGFSISLLDIKIYLPAIYIGIITFIFSLVGFYAGKKIGQFLEKKSEFVGGIILLAIGIKILLEHILSS